MDDDPWEGIEPERASLAKAIFGAARQIADEDGDGDFDLSDMPPAVRAVGSGFNRLVSLAAKGELDENDPSSVVDALRVASATLVDQRQPPQYQGFKWLTGGEPLVDPQKFRPDSTQAQGIAKGHDYFATEREKLFKRMKEGDRKAIDEFEVLHKEYMDFLKQGDKPTGPSRQAPSPSSSYQGLRTVDQPFGPQESQRIVGRTPEGKPIYEPQTRGWEAEVIPELPYETETSMRPKPPMDLREFPQGFTKRSMRRKGGGVY